MAAQIVGALVGLAMAVYLRPDGVPARRTPEVFAASPGFARLVSHHCMGGISGIVCGYAALQCHLLPTGGPQSL
jgi:hypothetical protein